MAVCNAVKGGYQIIAVEPHVPRHSDVACLINGEIRAAIQADDNQKKPQQQNLNRYLYILHGMYYQRVSKLNAVSDKCSENIVFDDIHCIQAIYFYMCWRAKNAIFCSD